MKSKKIGKVDLLHLISETIVSNRYLEEILNLIVTMTAGVMGSKICSLMLLDENKQELVIKATQSLSEEYRKKPNIKVGQSISGLALKEKKPYTILDVRCDKKFMYPDIAKKEGLCSMLSVPMMIRNKVIGVINSYTSRPHRFTVDEIKILCAVANQAAVAIENTKLMEESLAMKDALESRKLVEKAKGILMKENSLGEEEAYKLIHKKSMDTRKPMREIASAIILASEFKKKT